MNKVLIALAMLVVACAHRQDGPAMFFTAPGDTGDVVWVARTVTVQEGAHTRGATGVFACYRAEKPGPPVCYLARTISSPADLQWPFAK